MDNEVVFLLVIGIATIRIDVILTRIESILVVMAARKVKGQIQPIHPYIAAHPRDMAHPTYMTNKGK